MVFKEKKPLKNKSLANWQKEEKFQCSYEEAIKDIQQKEPPKDMPRANIQTSIKANLTRNFGSNIKNQFIKPISFTSSIKSTRPTNFTSSTEFTSVIKFTNSTISIRNINATRIIGSFSILEDITQKLLESKHTFTLGQLFKIVSGLRQCVAAKLTLGRKNIITTRLNLIIALVAIALHMVVI